MIQEYFNTIIASEFAHQTWPENKNITAGDAMEHLYPDKLKEINVLVKRASKTDNTPVFAVVGTLNAGKSSLTALFLSENGRSRVLRGVSQNQGTHRFTLWIPQSWKDDTELYNNVKNKVVEIFGSYELLSHEIQEALVQQNQQEKLDIPLLAFDPNLDVYKIALFDCIDIQRKDLPHKQANRLEILRKASLICSGMLYVVQRDQIEVKDIKEIEKRMPDVESFYAINKINPDESDGGIREVFEEVKHTLRLNNNICYFAFDYGHKNYRFVTSRWDDNLKTENGEMVPCFFQINDNNLPLSICDIDSELSIINIGNNIDREKIERKRIFNFRQKIAEGLRGLIERIVKQYKNYNDDIDDAMASLISQTKGIFIGNKGKLKMLMSEEILDAIMNSMIRTAPWYVKQQLRLTKYIQKWYNSAKEIIINLKSMVDLKGNLKNKAENIINKAGKSIKLDKLKKSGKTIDVEVITEILKKWGDYNQIKLSDEMWRGEADHILIKYIEAKKINISEKEWDEFTKEIWKNIPKHKAIWQATKIPVVLVVLLILIPLDGGIFSVPLIEVFLAAGLGGGIMGNRLAKDFEKALVSRQHIKFLAIASDRLGLPRQLIRKHYSEIVPELNYTVPDIKEEINYNSIGLNQKSWSMVNINEDNLKLVKEKISILGDES